VWRSCQTLNHLICSKVGLIRAYDFPSIISLVEERRSFSEYRTTYIQTQDSVLSANLQRKSQLTTIDFRFILLKTSHCVVPVQAFLVSPPLPHIHFSDNSSNSSRISSPVSLNDCVTTQWSPFVTLKFWMPSIGVCLLRRKKLVWIIVFRATGWVESLLRLWWCRDWLGTCFRWGCWWCCGSGCCTTQRLRLSSSYPNYKFCQIVVFLLRSSVCSSLGTNSWYDLRLWLVRVLGQMWPPEDVFDWC